MGRGPNAKLSTADIVRELDSLAKPGAVARKDGDVEKALGEAARRIEAIYQVPFLAHAAMEPMNCTVHVQPGRLRGLGRNAGLTRAQAAAAEVTGLPKEKVKVHNHLIGGGFGRRLDIDGVSWAVKVAQQVDGPVKVIWTREEDIQHDLYRPYYYDRLSAGLDGRGMPVAWTDRVTASSILARWAPPAFKNGLDTDAVEGATEPPYDASEHPRRLCPAGAAGHPNRVLARGRSHAQHLRGGKLHRRAGGGSQSGPARIPPCSAENPRARKWCSNWRLKSRAGAEAAGGPGPRAIGAVCFWHVPLRGGRG